MTLEVVVAVTRATHAKVRNLDALVRTDEAIASRQIAVDKVKRFQVLHARSDLGRNVN